MTVALTGCRPSPSCARSLVSCSRCPLRRFPLLVGWSQRELCKKIVAFPATSSTGDHTVSCGLPRCSTATRFQTIRSSPRTTSLTDLWFVVLELHQPSSHHALVPSALSGEGILALCRGRVSRCVTHDALVSLPRRVRETFVAQRRTTMVPP